MHVSSRILREQAEAAAQPTRAPTRAQIETHGRILAVGLDLLARYGRAALTTGRLAHALAISTSTFQRHFADIDTLLARLIAAELRRLTRLLAEIPAETPNRQAACRAAWFAATRRGAAHTRAHTLLIRDLALLPDDLRLPLERTRDALAAQLAGSLAPHCLALLNTPCFTQSQIETTLAALAAPAADAALPDRTASAPAHPRLSPSPETARGEVQHPAPPNRTATAKPAHHPPSRHGQPAGGLVMMPSQYPRPRGVMAFPARPPASPPLSAPGETPRHPC